MTKNLSMIGRFTVGLMAVILLTLLLLPSTSYALTVGEKAPDFHLITPQGRDVSYSKDIKDKKPVYLFFWTTW